MKKAETSKHHFLPRTYLKNFGIVRDNDFYVHVLQKNQDIENIVEKCVSDCCALNHKETPKKSEKSTQKLEDIYTEIYENHYESLFSVLTNDDITELSDEMKKSAVSAVISIFGRTRSWKDLIHLNTQSKKDFRLNKVFRIDHYFDSQGMRVDIRNKTLEELQINDKNIARLPLVVTQLKSALHLIEARQFDFINIYKIADDSEFITSDNPVVAININKVKSSTFDIDNAYYMPISNKYLLAVFPKEKNPSHNKIIRILINKEWVESFNNMQIFSRNQYIIGSKEALINAFNS
jgi:hypothetical protein